MQWRIVNERLDMSDICVYVQTEPSNETLKYFLSTISLEKYPELINAVSRSTRWGQEFLNINFFDEMDWEAKANLQQIGGIKKGEVNIYLYDGQSNDTILPENIFDKILHEYASVLLQLYSTKKGLPKNWPENMKIEIENLRNKIDHQL